MDGVGGIGGVWGVWFVGYVFLLFLFVFVFHRLRRKMGYEEWIQGRAEDERSRKGGSCIM